MRVRPKFLKLLSNDYALFLFIVTPIIFIGFSIYFYLSGDDNKTFFIVSILISIILLILFLYRLVYLLKLFKTGYEVKAIINSVGFYKDRGRINFSYEYEGRTYHTGNAVMKNKKTKQLCRGMEVSLIVNRLNYKKAIIKDIYY